MEAALNLARANAALIAILAPLIGGALALLMPRGRAACFVTWPATLIAAAAAIDLAWRALYVGGALQVAESGLALRLDGVGVASGALIAALGALIALASPALTGAGRLTPLSAALLMLAQAGWTGAAYAGDLISLLLAVETGVLATCALAAFGAQRDRAALSGTLRLLMASGVAAGLSIIGAALIARATGAVAFEAIAAEPHLAAPHAAMFGFVLVLGGLAIKAGVAPLHGWIGAFQARVAPLAALGMGALGAIAVLAAAARVAAYAFALPALGEGLGRALLALGFASVVIGSIQAIGARDVLRMTAYAAAAQAGAFLIAIAMGSAAGFSAALAQLLALAAAALALIAGATAAPYPVSLGALDGLARRSPAASVAMTLGALSLMGAPLTIGFLGRWRLIEAGVGSGLWWAAGAVIVCSLAGVFYGARLIERLYFRRASQPYEETRQPWRLLLGPAYVSAAVVILWGAAPLGLLHALTNAGRALTGFTP